VAPSGNQTVKGENNHQPAASEETDLFESKILMLRKRIDHIPNLRLITVILLMALFYGFNGKTIPRFLSIFQQVTL
jgi:hypothetical protein